MLAVDFFNHLNMLYGTITEFCTREEVSDIVILCLTQAQERSSVR